MRSQRCQAAPRRGLTLLEMLVTVALLVLIMTIITSIFRSATGAISTTRTYQQLDLNLRRIDSILRQDLNGITAKLTPPLNPRDNLGYFEYGEEQLSDVQGDDSDDYLAFTAKAPAGLPFTGRMMVEVIGTGSTTSAANGGPYGIAPRFQPVTVTSEFAEIIYFVRNGNLYRRVLLILPDRAGLTVGLSPVTGTPPTLTSGGGFFNQYPIYLGGATPTLAPIIPTLPLGQLLSWQGVNDISARPAPFIPATAADARSYTPIPNTLGDLTNREHRFGRPRFANDYRTNGTYAAVPDGLPDDFNLDPASGTYPGNGLPDYYPTITRRNLSQTFPSGAAFVNETALAGGGARFITDDTLGFPFVFRGGYSVAMSGYTRAMSIHGMGPQGSVVGSSPASPPGPTGTTPTAFRPNHSPLDLGDNLLIPSTPAQLQTWWGWPTWRETLSSRWTAPVKRINDPSTSPYFTVGAPSANDLVNIQAPGLSWVTPTLLPPMAQPYNLDQPFSDGAGFTYTSTAGFAEMIGATTTIHPVYEDDLILSNVRSFDIKAYNDATGTYEDLGYLDLDNLPSAAAAPLLTFGHEGRIPPRINENPVAGGINYGRFDPKYPIDPFSGYGRNVGDDDTTAVRLRRVFDTWSTDYTAAPDTPLNPLQGPPFASPAYPSYPPPYPLPLRGIQIQIRLVDSQGERGKSLTIKQDFTDKLR